MVNDLVIVNGQYRHRGTNERFDGVVPRDLQSGDLYEVSSNGEMQQMLILSNEQQEDGTINVRSVQNAGTYGV